MITISYSFFALFSPMFSAFNTSNHFYLPCDPSQIPFFPSLFHINTPCSLPLTPPLVYSSSSAHYLQSFQSYGRITHIWSLDKQMFLQMSVKSKALQTVVAFLLSSKFFFIYIFDWDSFLQPLNIKSETLPSFGGQLILSSVYF